MKCLQSKLKMDQDKLMKEVEKLTWMKREFLKETTRMVKLIEKQQNKVMETSK